MVGGFPQLNSPGASPERKRLSQKPPEAESSEDDMRLPKLNNFVARKSRAQSQFKEPVPKLDYAVSQILAKDPRKRTAADAATIRKALDPMLKNNEFMKSLPGHVRSQMAKMYRQVFLPKDEVIFLQGDRGNLFYIILQGNVRILVKSRQKENSVELSEAEKAGVVSFETKYQIDMEIEQWKNQDNFTPDRSSHEVSAQNGSVDANGSPTRQSSAKKAFEDVKPSTTFPPVESASPQSQASASTISSSPPPAPAVRFGRKSILMAEMSDLMVFTNKVKAGGTLTTGFRDRDESPMARSGPLPQRAGVPRKEDMFGEKPASAQVERQRSGRESARVNKVDEGSEDRVSRASKKVNREASRRMSGLFAKAPADGASKRERLESASRKERPESGVKANQRERIESASIRQRPETTQSKEKGGGTRASSLPKGDPLRKEDSFGTATWKRSVNAIKFMKRASTVAGHPVSTDIHGMEVAHLRASQSFGELALKSDAPRKATAMSSTAVSLLVVLKADFLRCMREVSQEHEEAERAMVKVLHSFNALANVAFSALKDIAPIVQHEQFEKGDVIAADQKNMLMFVKKGKMQICNLRPDVRTKVVAQLMEHPEGHAVSEDFFSGFKEGQHYEVLGTILGGDHIGESSVHPELTFGFYARALSPMQVVWMTATQFRDYCGDEGVRTLKKTSVDRLTRYAHSCVWKEWTQQATFLKT